MKKLLLLSFPRKAWSLFILLYAATAISIAEASSSSNEYQQDPTSTMICQDFGAAGIVDGRRSLDPSPGRLLQDQNETVICYDHPGWEGDHGMTCDRIFDEWPCQKPSSDVDNITASDACCSCGGGHMNGTENIPSFSPSSSPQPTTEDTKDCIDYSHWYSSMGPNYTCSFYNQKLCNEFGNGAFNFGHTPNTACCVCHDQDEATGTRGGYYVKDVIVPLSNATCYKRIFPRGPSRRSQMTRMLHAFMVS